MDQNLKLSDGLKIGIFPCKLLNALGKLKIFEDGSRKIEIGGFLYDMNEGMKLRVHN